MKKLDSLVKKRTEKLEKEIKRNEILYKKNIKLEENKNKIFEFNANKLYNYSSTEVRKAIKNGNMETLNKMLNKVEGRNYEKKHEQRRSEKTE